MGRASPAAAAAAGAQSRKLPKASPLKTSQGKAAAALRKKVSPSKPTPPKTATPAARKRTAKVAVAAQAAEKAVPPPPPAPPGVERSRPSKWDSRFLALAKHIAGWSKDPSTQVGCVIVGTDREVRSTGFNGFPRGISDATERYLNREEKLRLVCHAEENAIMHAARIGVSLKGCTSFCTWPPCTRCARSLLQAGVTEIVYPQEVEVPERWQEDFDCSSSMMREVGTIVRQA